jgi:hypothetical protein
MKLLNYCTTLIRALAVICIALSIGGSLAHGDNNPVTVEMSLASAGSITQGEPILLRYNVVNPNDLKAVVLTGVDQTEWYTLSLFDSNGKKAVPVTNTAVSYAGYSAGPGQYVEAGKTLEDYIVVTHQFPALRPGKYTLVVRVRLPYALMDSQANDSALEATKNSGTVVTQDFMYHINIAPMNTARLINTAETLREMYVKQRSQSGAGEQAKALLGALFSMPEAQASPSWAALANNTRMDAETIAKELVYVHTATSADILAQMLRNRSLSPDETAAVSQKLNEMYNTSDAKLKAHIGAIAASFGISMPEKVNIPSSSD